jgi:hypothetical protein
MWQKIMAVLAALALMLVTARAASAHTPIFVEHDITTPEQAWPVSDYQISWAFYARLAPANAPQYYALEGRAGDRLTANLEVPKIAGLENFRPALAVIGPGLPAFDAPRGLIMPEGYGGMLVNDSGVTPRAQFDEPFSQTSYYRGPQLDMQLPQTGRYYVVVQDETGGTGKYTLAIGTREVFGGGDPNWAQKLRAFFSDAGQDPVAQPTPQPAFSVDWPLLPVLLPMWFKS